jgi:hypothetical protein
MKKPGNNHVEAIQLVSVFSVLKNVFPPDWTFKCNAGRSAALESQSYLSTPIITASPRK